MRFAKQIILFMVIAGCLSTAFAGEKNRKRKPDREERATAKEMVLDDIMIEGDIDRPNVTILPTRERLQLPEVGFVHRSFQEELKMLPVRALLFNDDFDGITKVENFERLLQEIVRSARKSSNNKKKQ